MTDNEFKKLGKHIYQVYDPSKDLPDLYATTLSFEEFDMLLRDFARSRKDIDHPNDGSFEEYASSKGLDVVQLKPEEYVNWEEVI
ncbi:MAG: hypothetical protein QXU98_01685 [Candidatus Parvarchaeota archaeon]